MKVKELIAKLLDEDQEADAIVLAQKKPVRLEVMDVEGKSADFGGVVITAEIDDDRCC